MIDFLAHQLPHLSRKQIKRTLDRGGCLVNGQLVWMASWCLHPSDSISWHANSSASPPPSLEAIYEDEAFCLLHKGASIVSDLKTLSVLLNRPAASLWLVHRLDKGTSGLLLLAKSEAACQALEAQFRQRTVEKEYLAIVEQPPRGTAGAIELPLYRLPQAAAAKGVSMAIASASHQGDKLEAFTQWHCLKRRGPFGLLLCRPRTGRTHQIRLHLASMGSPVVGDRQYGSRSAEGMEASRHYLHSWKITFSHPTTGERLSFRANPSSDFEAMAARLGVDLLEP